MFAVHCLGNLAKDSIEDLLGEFHGFCDRQAGGDDAHIYLSLTRKANARDHVSPKVDEAAIDCLRQLRVS